MFGAPARITKPNGETTFAIDVNVTPLGVELEYTNEGLVFEKDVQPRFRTLQNLVLSELANEKHLFKNPPSLASLEAITPNWGFVSSGGHMTFTPYAKFQPSDIPSEKRPCLVDIQLKGIEMSRSTICPVFKLHYLGQKPNTIDLDWESPQQSNTLVLGDEITEVSDVPVAEGGTVFTLADPAVRAREMEAAKARVRAAFVAAEEARTVATTLAKNFYETYDLSDSESAFTEWLSDSDLESESD